MKFRIPIRATVAIILTICISVAVLTTYSLKNIYGSLSPRLALKISEITNAVDNNYYFEKNNNEIEDAIASGYMSGIGDKYAAYYSKDNATVVKNKYSGNSHGIGMLCVNTPQSEIYVWRVYAGSSAENAGLATGDVITHINAKSVAEIGYNKAVNALQGKSGKKSDLTYIRNGHSRSVEVVCGDYDVQSVFYNLYKKDIGYINITAFNSKTFLQFKNAVEELKKQGAEKYIIDLRHNGGGTVDSAANILDYLLPGGNIIHVKNKNGDVSVRNRSDENSLNAPIVILADNKSASASEILISAMKDFNAATFMGTKTYGKSLIQRTYALSDGSLIKFTVGEFVRASGESYNEKGLIPDIELTPSYKNDYEFYFMTEENDTMLKSAISQLS